MSAPATFAANVNWPTSFVLSPIRNAVFWIESPRSPIWRATLTAATPAAIAAPPNRAIPVPTGPRVFSSLLAALPAAWSGF